MSGPTIVGYDREAARRAVGHARVALQRRIAMARARAEQIGAEHLERPHSLIEFTQRWNSAYQPGRLHYYLAEQIETALQKGQWLIVSVPPQHGKTELISVNAPAKHLGGNPDAFGVAASYELGIAQSFSRKARNIVRSPEYGELYGVHLSRDSNSVTDWSFAGHRGGFFATGIGGPLTGRPASVLAIDDPVKNRMEADSEVFRQRNWDWWTGVARSRLHPGSVVFLVQTRWHYGDLAGLMLEGEDAHKFRVINIPARAEDDDPLGRERGEPLWVERHMVRDEFGVPVDFGRDPDRPEYKIDLDAANQWYTEMEVGVGPRDWTAMHQGHPTAQEDAIFKPGYWQWYDPEDLPRMTGQRSPWLYTVQFWDTAFKEKTSNDFNACVTLGVTGDKVYVLDVYNQRHEMPGLKAAAKAQAARFRPTHLYVEDKASGPSLAQELMHETTLSVDLWEPGGIDKVARAYLAQPMLAAGRVALPRSAPWLSAFLQQLERFPADVHDDMVDSLVGALLVVNDLWSKAREAQWVGEGTRGGRIDPRYVDRDTGVAPSPALVRRPRR